MNQFNFNSQICTDKVQSERLLALGLKKETADCYYWQETEPMYGEATGVWHLETLESKENQEHFEYLDKYFGVCLADDEEHYFIPAWSLHRLWELSIIKNVMLDSVDEIAVLYDEVINKIEELIKCGNFPKEYLVNQAEIEEHCKGVLEYLDYIRGEEE